MKQHNLVFWLAHFMPYRALTTACLTLVISLPILATSDAPDRPSQAPATFSLTEEEKRYLQQKKQIRLCVDPHWLPMESINASGTFEGIVADYIALLQAKTGLNIELYPTKTWDDSLQAARRRDCDILSSPVTPARKEFLYFTPPYFELTVGIIANNQKPSIKSIEEILSAKIATVSGYASEEMLRRQYPKANFIALESPQDGLAKLANGEVDYFIDYVLSSTYYKQKMSLPELKVVGLTHMTLPLSIGSRKDEPVLATILTKGQATITRKEINTIILNWMDGTNKPGSSLPLIGIIIICSIIIALMIILWRYMMPKT